MIGRLRDLTINRDGTQNVTVTVSSDFREEYDELKDAEIRIEIKRFSSSRSLDANAYCWVLIDKISEKTGIKKSDVYRNAIKEIGGNSAIVCVRNKDLDNTVRYWESKGLGWQAVPFPSKVEDCTNLTLYCGSSEYDTRQMAQLIDSLIQDAEALGIPTLTDEMAEKMLQRWGKKHESKAG